MTVYDGICRDMSGYQVGRIPDVPDVRRSVYHDNIDKLKKVYTRIYREVYDPISQGMGYGVIYRVYYDITSYDGTSSMSAAAAAA